MGFHPSRPVVISSTSVGRGPVLIGSFILEGKKTVFPPFCNLFVHLVKKEKEKKPPSLSPYNIQNLPDLYTKWGGSDFHFNTIIKF